MDKNTARLVLAAEDLIQNQLDSGEFALDEESLSEDNADIQEECTDQDGNVWHRDLWELKEALSAFDVREAFGAESGSPT